MLLYSNPRRCTSPTAKTLSYYFVAYEPDGSKTHALRRFDTQTNVGITLTDQEIFRPDWQYRINKPKGSPWRRVEELRRALAQEDPVHVDRVVVDLAGDFTSFCNSREVLRASRDLWQSDQRFSLVRTAEEQAIAMQAYREEKALDRLDITLLPYLDRLNSPGSPVSTEMSCDGERPGPRAAGYLDFRTVLTTQDISVLLTDLRYNKKLPVTLEMRPIGISQQRYKICYSLQAREKGWDVFEPILAAFCNLVLSRMPNTKSNQELP